MKKRLFFIYLLYIFILFLISPLIIAQEPPDIGNIIPGGDLISNIEIDERTGNPKKFNDLKENYDAFKNRENNKSYLLKSVVVILGKNPVIGPMLFYTEKVFSYFNPFWKVILGVKFSWSGAFILSFLTWTVLIILVFFPARGLFPNLLINVLVSLIIASLIGISGGISKFIEFIGFFVEGIFGFIIFVALLFLGIAIYIFLFVELKKESEEIELDSAKDKIKELGKISGETLKKLSE